MSIFYGATRYIAQFKQLSRLTVYVEVGNPPGIVNQLNCHYRSALFKLNKQKTHLIYS